MLHARVTTNLYAGWRHDNGFEIHWDWQDVLILQVSGRKHWKVWNPTRIHPVFDDRRTFEKQEHGSGPPVWDAPIEPGSLFHIPRGWWHVVYPMDEPSLHLTISVESPTGLDLLKWLAKDRMRRVEAARASLPVTAPPEEKKLWMENLKRELDAAWSETLFDDFIAASDMEAPLTRTLDLLADVDPRRGRVDMTAPIRLALRRPLQFLDREGKLVCEANGSEWEVAPHVAERLRLLNDFEPHTVGSLAQGRDLAVIAVVMTMIRSGVIRTANP